MAKKKHNKRPLPDKDELVRRLALSRDRLEAETGRLGSALDIRTRVSDSLRRNPRRWLSLATAAGVLYAFRPGRRKGHTRGKREEAYSAAGAQAASNKRKSVSFAGSLIKMLKLLLPVLKPVALALATRQASALADKISHRS